MNAWTRADIEKAVAEWVDDAPEIVDEVWSLVSGDDPAVYVVRESDIAAVEVKRNAEGDCFSDRVWKRAYESMRRERDAAVRRAKQAETEFEKAKNSTLSQLDWAGFLCGEEYQDLVERAEQAERELGELRSKVNAWGREHSAPALSRADIEKVVAEWVDDAPEIVNEVWALVSGADPAVYVIRESDLPTVQQDEDGEWYPGDRWDLADDRFIDVEGALEKMHLYAAIARAIEAEQAADPVEALADDFAQALAGDENIGGSWSMDPAAWRDIARALARRAHDVLGQEVER